MLRTKRCGEVNKSNIGSVEKFSGWVHRRRDHGGVIFIDLRDRWGYVQIKFDINLNADAYNLAQELRSEWVVFIEGKIVARPNEMVNQNIFTGEIEVEALNLIILNKSKTPPFEIEDKKELVNENLRLKYRFIDLRREAARRILEIKDKFHSYVRSYFHNLDFIEVQTPILANSSPEGARDFLVPSRYYHGKFYALPQAPQQFKQLLMVGGFDRYFQIAPCFRDEDPRADRLYGEFYQLDMEMSFVEQDDIFQIMEPLMIGVTKEFSNKEIINLENNRFQKIAWKEALEKYGSDKPDLRFGLEIVPVTNLVHDSGFGVFDNACNDGGVVHALKVDNGGKFTRSEIDNLTELAKTKGAKGLAYIIFKEDGPQSPILKFLKDGILEKIQKDLDAKSGDIVFFGADKWKIVCDSLGAVRNKCGEVLGLKDDSKASWCWIVDFPMYELSDEGKIDFAHNPFSMPEGGLDSLNTKDPLNIMATQYDLVLNGFEVSSGAIRNYNPEIMYKAFGIAGYSKDIVDQKFGAMIRAFEYGAPPHGGNAPGIDRILMILLGTDSIRDLYAFPKDGQGRDVMMDSPNTVEEKQLKELNIKINNQ